MKDENKTKDELISELEELRAKLSACSNHVSPKDGNRVVVDTLPLTLYEIDLQGRFTYLNRKAMRSFGYSQDDLDNGLHVNKVIHPDDLERAQDNIKRTLDGYGSEGVEYLSLHRDGTIQPIRVYSLPIYKDGQPIGIRGTAIDITDIKESENALRQSESYYRSLFNNTGTAMSIFGDDSIIRICNSNFETLSGYSREEIEGKMKWSDFVPPEELERMRGYHAERTQEDHNAPMDYEFAFAGRDERKQMVHVFIQYVPETGERVCSLIDVTDMRRAEEALTRMNEELENEVGRRTAELQEKATQLQAANIRLTELDAIKSSLVSSISHELRTPLTSIRGFAKLTGRDFFRHFFPLTDSPKLNKKGERIRKNLEIIESEGERLTRLINDFLDINRIESGKATWNDCFINPCEVIHRAVQSLSGAFAAKDDLSLVADLPAKVPPVHADPDKIQQVLVNLLGNACKFTQEGTVTVSLVENPDTVTVTVVDTGLGIPIEEQANIFEKFHKSRAGDTISIKDKGTGLGLAICREIVEHYGGAIWVDSTPGKGSAFSFTLPSIPGTVTSC